MMKIAKNGPFATKIHHKSGHKSKFWQLEAGTFLKTGWQTPVHAQVMYLHPPPGDSVDVNIANEISFDMKSRATARQMSSNGPVKIL